MIVAKHVAGILFLVQFNNFDWSMGSCTLLLKLPVPPVLEVPWTQQLSRIGRREGVNV